MYDFRAFSFGEGSHLTRDDGMCVMEAVAYLAGEEHSDKPECASPVIAKLAIWLNDSLNDDQRREWLSGLPYRLVGTAATPEIELQRAFMAADWAVRVVCPAALRDAGLTDEAESLERLAVVDCADAAGAANAAARAVAHAATRAAAHAAAHAARAAARAADGAANAAANAADGAAAYAANAAAYAAAYAAHVEPVQRSCLDLIDRMIRLTEIREVVPVSEQLVTEKP